MEAVEARRQPDTEAAALARGVAQEVEGDILRGMLGAGEWLRLGDMAERYRATRSEVRAAFTRLAAQRILEHTPNRGYRVMTVDEEELVQRVEIRLLLELPIAALVIKQAARPTPRS